MLSEKELLASPVVANSTMNRGRGFRGVNSYERELGFEIGTFLRGRTQARWLDACCGEGRALWEAAECLPNSVEIVGVDLIDRFLPGRAPNVQLIAGDLRAAMLPGPYDLITCVHGLHYLGDKLGLLEQCHQSLAPGGLLLAHLDPANLRSPGGKPLWPRLLRSARSDGVTIRLSRNRLRIERTEARLDFRARFLGATVSEQPNSTGITVIDSWYAP